MEENSAGSEASVRWPMLHALSGPRAAPHQAPPHSVLDHAQSGDSAPSTHQTVRSRPSSFKPAQFHLIPPLLVGPAPTLTKAPPRLCPRPFCSRAPRPASGCDCGECFPAPPGKRSLSPEVEFHAGLLDLRAANRG